MKKVWIAGSGLVAAYLISNGSKKRDAVHGELHKWNSGLYKSTNTLCTFLTEEEKANVWSLIHDIKKLDTSTRRCDSWYLNRSITDMRNYVHYILKHKSLDVSLLEQESIISSILDNVLHNNILKYMVI